MVLRRFLMEPDLQSDVNPQDELLSVAAMHASDGHLLCTDVSAMVFPRSQYAPTDEMLSAVSQKLTALVSGIESALRVDDANAAETQALSWRLLARSGFLREAPLIDFVLARHCEDRLSAKISTSGEFDISAQLPVRLLASADPVLASAAQVILAANSMQKHPARLLHREMGAELLHQLCWRVVAALQVEMGQQDAAVLDNAKALLAGYDEGQTVKAAARKAVHFLSNDQRSDCINPAKAGLHLFVALLASESGLDQDHVLRLIDGGNSAPLAVLLRILNVSRDDAMAVICLFKGFNLTPREISLFDARYDSLSSQEAHEAIRKWAVARTQFLAFPGISASHSG
jgi:hypothetical protein